MDDTDRSYVLPTSYRPVRHIVAAPRAHRPNMKAHNDMPAETSERQDSGTPELNSAGCSSVDSLRRSSLRSRVPCSARAPIGPESAQPAQCRLQVSEEHRKRPPQRGRAANQHIVVTRCGILRQYESRRFTHPPTDAIAHHRIADLAAGRYTDPNFATRLMHTILIVRPPNLQDKPRRRTRPSLPGGAHELRSAPQVSKGDCTAPFQAERRFRPRLRRAAITRRPPTVAMR